MGRIIVALVAYIVIMGVLTVVGSTLGHVLMDAGWFSDWRDYRFAAGTADGIAAVLLYQWATKRPLAPCPHPR